MNLEDKENYPLNAIFNQAPFGLVILSTSGQIENANTKAASILGLSASESLIGREIVSFVQSTDIQLFKGYLENLTENGYIPGWKMFNLLNSEGNLVRVLFYGQPNLNQSENGLVIYFMESNVDFRGTDRDNLPTIDLLGSKYWSIFEFASMGVAVLDENLNIDEVNQTFADYFNLDRESIKAKHFSQVFDQKTYQTVRNLQKDMKSRNNDFGKNVISTKPVEGEQKTLEISLANLYIGALEKNMLVMIVEDITHQHDTHHALIQSEKLALTGRLAASLAHEINNPLQTSIGCLGLAEEMLIDDDRDLRVYIHMAMEELQRSARIVKKLRDLNRITEDTDKSLVDLKELIEGVLVLTKKRLFDRNIVPVFPFEGEPPFVIASGDQIQQVFLNLIMNAIDALPNGGNIYLDIIKTYDPVGEKVVIRDTGVGVKEEDVSRLFNPFYTTKDDGLGLGLFICKNIVEDHNGTLTVESQPGVGTAFSIWLPGMD